VVAGVGAHPDDGDPLTAMAAELRNGGTEVIFAGWHQTLPQVVRAALQEDAEAIGLSGAAEAVLARVRGLLAEEGAADITVFTVPR